MREVTKDDFRDAVARGTVLVDVWGPGCALCVAMMPQVEQLAEVLGDVAVVKLDSSKNRRLCIEMRVMGLPAFLLFRDGQEVSRIGGSEVTFDRMKAWLDQNLDNLENLDTQEGG